MCSSTNTLHTPKMLGEGAYGLNYLLASRKDSRDVLLPPISPGKTFLSHPLPYLKDTQNGSRQMGKHKGNRRHKIG